MGKFQRPYNMLLITLCFHKCIRYDSGMRVLGKSQHWILRKVVLACWIRKFTVACVWLKYEIRVPRYVTSRAIGTIWKMELELRAMFGLDDVSGLNLLHPFPTHTNDELRFCTTAFKVKGSQELEKVDDAITPSLKRVQCCECLCDVKIISKQRDGILNPNSGGCCFKVTKE